MLKKIFFYTTILCLYCTSAISSTYQVLLKLPETKTKVVLNNQYIGVAINDTELTNFKPKNNTLVIWESTSTTFITNFSFNLLNMLEIKPHVESFNSLDFKYLYDRYVIIKETKPQEINYGCGAAACCLGSPLIGGLIWYFIDFKPKRNLINLYNLKLTSAYIDLIRFSLLNPSLLSDESLDIFKNQNIALVKTFNKQSKTVSIKPLFPIAVTNKNSTYFELYNGPLLLGWGKLLQVDINSDELKVVSKKKIINNSIAIQVPKNKVPQLYFKKNYMFGLGFNFQAYLLKFRENTYDSYVYAEQRLSKSLFLKELCIIQKWDSYINWGYSTEHYSHLNIISGIQIKFYPRLNWISLGIGPGFGKFQEALDSSSVNSDYTINKNSIGFLSSVGIDFFPTKKVSGRMELLIYTDLSSKGFYYDLMTDIFSRFSIDVFQSISFNFGDYL